jgi:pimeloyl-ACP methyl ester carboxylesterase
MLRTLLPLAGAILAASLVGSASASDFNRCADAGTLPELTGSLCAIASAPLDHQRIDDGRTVDLFVRKFPADGPPRGSVWLIAGGPGESGASFYPLLPRLRTAFPGFDLLIPDHRGTGYSSKLCPVEEAPDSAEGIALAGSEWAGCIASVYQDPDRAGAFTITNAARDLAGLIEAGRQDGPVYVYAVSYGTQMVLRMMQAAPLHLDGLILDSLVPPETTDQWDLSHRTQITDATGRAVLGEQDQQSYRHLLQAAEESPPWLERIPGQNIKAFMGVLLDFPSLRSKIPELSTQLADNETTLLDAVLGELRAIGEPFSRYPQSPSSLPLVMAISGSENNARPDLKAETVAAEAAAAWFTSPLPGYLVDNPFPPYARDALFGGEPVRLPRTLVLHGTLDPKTPYVGAVRRIEDLAPGADVTLVTVDEAPHFILLTAPQCFERAVTSFLNGQNIGSPCSL